MPGMRSGLDLGNPVLAAAFRSALLHQGLVALLIFGVLALAWVSVREWRPGGVPGPGSAGPGLGGDAGFASGLTRLRVGGHAASQDAEPSWRMLLRVGFGLLWILDGLLQAQPSMVVGLPSQVTQPSADSSPAWVQHLVNWAGTSWSYHPVQAAAAAVWIQAGIGCWLLAARRGWWSRLAGLASLAWGLVVWVFGESFGGIFAPALTWLFGAPGAAIFYCAAGGLIALPSRYWRAPWLGRAMLGVLGLFFTGMAVLQAWPGRGFWQGRLGHGPGTLTDMIQSMAQTPQPAFLADWVGGFGSFTAAHGFAVNMFAVVALALIGSALLAGAALPGRRRPLIRLAVIAAVLLCLADWVLIEDLGVFGGLGTDPNSMIPMALVLVAGYLAIAPATARATATAAMAAGADSPVSLRADRAIQRAAQVLADAGTGADEAREPGAAAPPGAGTAADEPREPGPLPLADAGTGADEAREPGPPALAGAGTGANEAQEAGAPDLAEEGAAGREPAGQARGWRGRLSPGRLAGAFGAADARTLAAAWALGVTILGAFPLAAAAANRSADPVIARAIDGSGAALNFPAPGFRLTDQDGKPVSLAGLRGKVVLLTFLDPVCTSDCPLIAQEFRAADQLLGAKRRDVVLVAVVANPVYYTTPYTRAFDRQEGLAGLPNWKFLSGPLPALRRVWHDYYFPVQNVPAGGMSLHGDVAYVIDAAGRTRTELNFDPGPGTAATKSSFAAELTAAALKAMKSA